MKIYLCLFLFALICCNPIKKDEPKLLDGGLTDEEMKLLLESIMKIVENCGDMDLECVMGQLYTLYDSLPEETQNKIKDMVLGGNCEGFCEEFASEIVGSTIADFACDALCSSF